MSEVLCGASAYDEKYYFNKKFSKLPKSVQDELQIICVLFTEEIGGQFFMEFDDEKQLVFRTQAADWDYNYDEIGAGLMIKEIRKNRQDLLQALELFYSAVSDTGRLQ